MKKALASPLGVVAIALIIASCTNSVDPSLSDCRVVNSTLTKGGKTTTQTFSYNAKKQLISSTTTQNASSWTTAYTYDSEDKLIHVYVAVDSSIDYFYNGSRQLIKDSTNYFKFGFPSWIVRKYSYNAHGQLSVTEVIESICVACVSTTTYTYPDTSTKNYSSSITNVVGNTYTTAFEYDSHVILDRSVDFLHFTTDNYPKKVTTVYGPNTSVLDYAYVFNSKGYPTSITMTSTDLSQSFSNLITYSCP